MDKKISQLPGTTYIQEGDLLAIVQDGVTKKVAYGDVKTSPTNELGWGRYDDNEWTEASPLPLLDGVKVVLTNNASSAAAYGSFSFFDSAAQRIVAQNVNDTYMVTVVFKGKAANANSTHLDLHFYSPTGDFDRLSKTLPFDKGNNQEQNFHNVFQYYADADLVNNGLEIQINSHGGSAEVYDIIFFIQRTQNNG